MAATLLELRNQVLVNLNDLQDPITGEGDRYKVPNLNIQINGVVQQYVRLLNSNYQGYLNAEIAVDITAGDTAYDLGSDFRSPIYQVRRTINNVIFYQNPISTYNAILSTQTVPNVSWCPSYHLEGNFIVFSYPPQDDEMAASIVQYQGKVPDMVMDSDELNDQLYDAEDCIVIRSTLRALKAKDVSGALKNITGWEKELIDAERAFYQQVGNRYVKPDKPIPIPNGEGGEYNY